jgi:hypothetical protein
MATGSGKKLSFDSSPSHFALRRSDDIRPKVNQSLAGEYVSKKSLGKIAFGEVLNR